MTVATVSTADLLRMSQKQLDDLYLAAEPGPIPDGEGKGTAIIAPGTAFSPEIAQVISVFAWQGKVFDKSTMTLRNHILPFGLKAVIARVREDVSWLDGKPCIVLDYSETSMIVHWLRDEIRLVGPGLYLGKVFWGRTRLMDFSLEFAA